MGVVAMGGVATTSGQWPRMNLATGAQGFRPLPLAAARVVDRNPDGQQAQPLLVGQSCHQSRGLGLGHSYYIHTTCFMPEVTSGRHLVLATPFATAIANL